MTRLAKLALATTAATLLLIAVGGLVRATDSGLGCPDWPLCFGSWVPPGDLHAWIEHAHRLVAAGLVGPLVAALAVVVVARRRQDRPMLAAAIGAALLALVQSGLGAAVVLLRLPAQLVSAHLALALTLLGLLVFVSERAVRGPLPRRPRGGLAGLAGLAALSAALIFGQMLLGSWVTGQGAGLAFGDFPLMDGALLPALAAPAEQIQFAHRALAVVVAAVVVLLAVRVFRETDDPAARRLAAVSVLLVAAQVALGAANVWSRLSALFVVPHLAVGALLWATAVALALSTRRLGVAPTHAGGRWRAYVALTKPRIIELLLVTTLPTMVLAEGGIPAPWLIAATLIGGTLAAGGANAINCYLDRDIDDLMRRTRHRPLPRQEVTPAAALRFGIGLSAVSFAWLTATVNLLSAVLALSAVAFYVFVYTLWLKRSTPQNIVIGGAAGCMPVLVGWAAVTGEVGIPAIVLFAIIFYWTPPHFWALALRYRADYAAASVPMLPVVRGEAETARQIVLYSLVLVGVTLLLVPVAGMGLVYLGATLVLGAIFIGHALRLLRAEASAAAAIGLFRYSISYLALLFGAIALDSLVRLPLG